MKSKIHFLLVSLLCLFFPLSVYADDGDHSNETFHIEVGNGEINSREQIRRSPTSQIVKGTYTNGCLELHFRQDIGMVSCSVINVDTEEIAEEIFDSGEETIAISVPTSSGLYNVILSTDCGTYNSSYIIK